MKRGLLLMAIAGCLLLSFPIPIQAATGPVLLLEIRDVINPASSGGWSFVD